jgi:membrane protease YdiL (CAAX protease family)
MTADLTTQFAGGPAVERRASGAKWRVAISRHQLPAFFTLAFLFSWYPWIIAMARGQTSGPNPLGPLIAALLVAGIAEGWGGVRDLLGRIVRARFGLRWYAVIFGLPIAICAGAVAVTAAFGKGVPFPNTAAWRELPDRFLFIFLFIGLGEEPGWRGFALPRLQNRRTPLRASMILAPIWALWHLPLMGNEFPVAVIPAFLMSLLGGTLIQTWLFNRTKGSVFAQMLFHATVNTVGPGLVFPLFKGAGFVAFWYVYAALWLIIGFTVCSRCPIQVGTPFRGVRLRS